MDDWTIWTLDKAYRGLEEVHGGQGKVFDWMISDEEMVTEELSDILKNIFKESEAPCSWLTLLGQILMIAT